MKITILGGGPGGYVAALKAAILGAEVYLVEKEAIGGTCLNRGCIPTKAYLSCSDVYDHVAHSHEFGVELGGVPKADFSAMFTRKDAAVSQLVQGVGYLLKRKGVTVYKGCGELVSNTQVKVTYGNGNTEIIETDKIVLATGSVPILPAPFKHDGERVLSSKECLRLEEIPKSMIIVGGGVIGCEFGQFFKKMGTEVTIVEMADTVLPFEDADVSGVLGKSLAAGKINLKLGTRVVEVNLLDDGVACVLSDGESLRADKMLVAIGRRANTANLGLEALGVALDNGKVQVDECMRTNVDNLYAIGDIVDSPFLAHVASREGVVAVEHIMGKEACAKYHAVPRCVYTSPEVAAVGMTEKQAAEKGIEVRVGRFSFAGIGKALVIGKTDGFVKVIVDDKDTIIGGAVVGPHATDLLAELTLSVHLGVTAMQLGEVIHPHPTLSEALMEAVHDVHRESVHAF